MLTYFEVDDPVKEPGSHKSRPDQVDYRVDKGQRNLITAQLHPAWIQRDQCAL